MVPLPSPRLHRVPRWARRNPRRALVAGLLPLLLLLPGLAQVDTTPDPAAVVPAETAEGRAATNVSTGFKSTFTQKVSLVLQVDRDACLEDSRRNIPQRHGPSGDPGDEVRCGNITDEVYVRAADELYRFLSAYERGETVDASDPDGAGPLQHMVALPTFHRLANWTLAGGQDDAPPGAFALPPEDDRARWSALERTRRGFMGNATAATLDGEYESAAMVLLVDPDSPLEPQEVGRTALEARQAYLEWAGEHGRYKVLTGDNAPLVASDPPVASAHTAALLQGSLPTVLGLALGAVLLVGWLATGSPRGAAALLLPVALAPMAALGLAGFAGAALTPFVLAALGLALGLAADLALRTVRAPGAAASSVPLTCGALLLGGAVYAASPSALLADAGLVAAASAATAAWASLLLAPALATLLNMPRSTTWSLPRVPRAAAGAVLAGLVVLGLLAVPLLQAQPLRETSENWPRDDPFRREHEEAARVYHDVERGEASARTHILVVEGDVTDPATLDHVEALRANLSAEARGNPVLDTGNSRTLGDILRLWRSVGDGPQGAAGHAVGEELARRGVGAADPEPSSRQEVEAELDALFASPMASFGGLFVDHPDDDITVVPVSVRDGGLSDAREAVTAVRRVVDGTAAERPGDVSVALVGKAPAVHLVATRQMPWAAWAGLALAGAAAAGAVALGRSRREAAVVAAAAPLTLVPATGVLAVAGVGVGPASAVPVLALAAVPGWTLHAAREPPGTWLAFPLVLGLVAGALSSVPLLHVRDAAVGVAVVAGVGAVVAWGVVQVAGLPRNVETPGRP